VNADGDSIRGTPVFTQSEARLHFIGVRAGTLDDPELAKPQMTIWTSSAPSWAATSPASRMGLSRLRRRSRC